jgi:hypothetical protein
LRSFPARVAPEGLRIHDWNELLQIRKVVLHLYIGIIYRRALGLTNTTLENKKTRGE